MTNWAAPFVSTTRRASSASPTCPRDWCTSLSTRCEAAAEWQRTATYDKKPKGHTMSRHALEHLRWRGTRALVNPNGSHFHWQRWETAAAYLCTGPRAGGQTMWLPRLLLFFFSLPAAEWNTRWLKNQRQTLMHCFFICMICLLIQYDSQLPFTQQTLRVDGSCSPAPGKRPIARLLCVFFIWLILTMFELEPVSLPQLNVWLGLFYFYSGLGPGC